MAPIGEQPLISIVMITYNRADLIQESILSVVTQTYKNWELIIIDDGSTDKTKSIINGYGDPRIQYHYINHSGFLGKVRNIGLRMAKGELIAFQDSDDTWVETKLQTQVSLLQRYPDAAFVLSNNLQIGENSKDVPEYSPLFVGHLFKPMLIKNQYHFCGTSLIFKTTILHQFGYLDESVKMMREFNFFLRMSAFFPGIFINDKLVKVRRHATNTSNSYGLAAHETHVKMVKEFFDEKLISKSEYEILTSGSHYRTGLELLKRNEVKTALRAFFQSCQFQPNNWKIYVRIIQCLLKYPFFNKLKQD